MNESQHHTLESDGLCLFTAMGDTRSAGHLPQYLGDEIGACPLAPQAWAAGCLKGCVYRLAMAPYPGAWWHDDMSQDDVDELLSLLEESMPARGYWIC